jgi:prepilin-type N-terminal cleavage/methylation domain-containing protein/prepilin-type processing-associated H-X9-DG protein
MDGWHCTACRSDSRIRSLSSRPICGFTLVELLVVVAILAVLLAAVMPSLSGAKELARRAVCSSNQHSLSLAFNAYASDNRGKLPQHPQYGGNWLWDLPHLSLDDLIECGARKHMFFCPSGDFGGVKEDKYWNYTPDFSVTGYWWLNKRTQGNFPPLIDRRYLVHTHEEDPAEIELGSDAVIARNDVFYGVIGGLGPTCPHRTNHMKGLDPVGGNILFLDGHARWRLLEDMEMHATAPWPDHWF